MIRAVPLNGARAVLPKRVKLPALRERRPHEVSVVWDIAYNCCARRCQQSHGLWSGRPEQLDQMEPSGSAILLAKLRADLGLGSGCIDLAPLEHHQIQIVSQG